ncbi:hypothetical protein HYQ46_003901 [Verticillium longisporum]|nr:hypothetical protein HYQ46_003901 [Verticillium longisporum]
MTNRDIDGCDAPARSCVLGRLLLSRAQLLALSQGRDAEADGAAGRGSEGPAAPDQCARYADAEAGLESREEDLVGVVPGEGEADVGAGGDVEGDGVASGEDKVWQQGLEDEEGAGAGRLGSDGNVTLCEVGWWQGRRESEACRADGQARSGGSCCSGQVLDGGGVLRLQTWTVSELDFALRPHTTA